MALFLTLKGTQRRAPNLASVLVASNLNLGPYKSVQFVVKLTLRVGITTIRSMRRYFYSCVTMISYECQLAAPLPYPLS